MAFTNSFRMERVYFERLKSMIDILKPYLNTETDEKLKSILENSIDDNGAILLLYRNLGECWAELSDLIKKADEKIDSLDDKSEKYHDELNKRIDEVNNYIMGILREIEARLETVEQDLATLSRNIILDLERVNDEYTLSYKGDPVDFAQLAEWVSFPHNVIVRGVVNGEETVFHLREFDTDETSGVFEFFATGLINNVVHEITVTVLPDDSVTVATVTQTVKEYTAGNGINISSDDEISVDFDVVQEKLTPGSGISIDPITHEIENTAQGRTYTAGKNIDITNDAITANLPLFVNALGTKNTLASGWTSDVSASSDITSVDNQHYYGIIREAYVNKITTDSTIDVLAIEKLFNFADAHNALISNFSAFQYYIILASISLNIIVNNIIVDTISTSGLAAWTTGESLLSYFGNIGKLYNISNYGNLDENIEVTFDFTVSFTYRGNVNPLTNKLPFLRAITELIKNIDYYLDT